MSTQHLTLATSKPRTALPYVHAGQACESFLLGACRLNASAQNVHHKAALAFIKVSCVLDQR